MIVFPLYGHPLDQKRVAQIKSVPYDLDMDEAVLVKRQCVRAVDESGERVLGVAIPLPTVCEREGLYKMEGQWAGDRLAIISENEFEDIL